MHTLNLKSLALAFPEILDTNIKNFGAVRYLGFDRK